MNQKDMRKLNFFKNDRVIVQNNVGHINDILVKPYKIKEGAVLMYYPEVNVLISQKVDPLSRTPGFKSMIVSVDKSLASSN